MGELVKESCFSFSDGHTNKEKSAAKLCRSFIRKVHHGLQFPPFPGFLFFYAQNAGHALELLPMYDFTEGPCE